MRSVGRQDALTPVGHDDARLVSELPCGDLEVLSVVRLAVQRIESHDVDCLTLDGDGVPIQTELCASADGSHPAASTVAASVMVARSGIVYIPFVSSPRARLFSDKLTGLLVAAIKFVPLSVCEHFLITAPAIDLDVGFEVLDTTLELRASQQQPEDCDPAPMMRALSSPTALSSATAITTKAVPNKIARTVPFIARLQHQAASCDRIK